MSCNCLQIIKRYDDLINKFLIYNTFKSEYGLDLNHPICENLFAQPANELVIQQINIKLYHSTLQKEEWWKAYVSSNNFKNKERYSREYIERTIDGLNFKFAGVLENGMRILYKDLFPNQDVSSLKYNKVYSKILTENKMIPEIKLFELMATLRNLVHNSGVYTLPDKVINWKDKEYIFVRNKMPHCGYKAVDSYLDYYNDLNSCLVKLVDSVMSHKLAGKD